MDRKRRAQQNDAEEPKKSNAQGLTTAKPVARDPDSLSWFERLPQDLLGELLDRVPEAVPHLRRVSGLYIVWRGRLAVLIRKDD